MSLQVVKLEKLLALCKLSPTSFRTLNLPLAPTGSRGTFGGTIVAQSLLASMNTIPKQFIPTSLHCYFISGGNPSKMITYNVESLREGKNFIHKQVRAYQDETLIFTSIILFSIGKSLVEVSKDDSLHHLKKINVPPLKGNFQYSADLFRDTFIKNEKNRKRLNQLPIISISGGEKHIEIMHNSFKTQAMEYYFPPTFFTSSEEERKESLNYFVKIRNESLTLPEVPTSSPDELDLITPENDVRYNYAAFAYLSDSYLLLTLPYFNNLPLYSHRFSVSLDHAIYFHQLPKVNDLIYLNIENSRSSNDKHLVQAEYYNDNSGEIIASVSQEGLVIYDPIKHLRSKL